MSKLAFQRAFQELTEAEVTELVEQASRVCFASGTRILREGEINDHIFVILAGTIRVAAYLDDGEERALCDPFGPGDTFGEMSFIDHLGASATLIAETDVTAKVVGRQLIEEMAARQPSFMERLYLSLLFTLIRRLRRIDVALSFAD